MKNSNRTLKLCFGTFIIICQTLSAQTTTFNYLTSGLNSSDCNVFDPVAIKISNYYHYPYAGGVGFNVNNGLSLFTKATPSPAGTAFYIDFLFSSNYKYTITITAKGSCSNCGLLLRTGVLSSLNGFPTAGGGLCTPDGNVTNYQYSGAGSSANAVTTQNTDYNIPEFTVSGNPLPSKFFIWSKGGNTSLDVIYISKIVITQTPVASFNITPATISYACGTTSAKTFTINNSAGTPGITNYSWTLGTNNGWRHNGSNAPSTISTGTTNTITLTPICGALQKPISAIVTANSINYNTSNIVTPSITPPVLSINGATSLCSGQTNYSITGLVCNSTIAWTPPPSNLATLSSLNSSPTGLTKGNSSGNFTLSATVSSCSQPQIVSLPVHVGQYTADDYILDGNGGSNYYCINKTYSFSLLSKPGTSAGATNYVWTIPAGWTMVYNGGQYIAIKAPSTTSPPSGTLSVSFTETCGSTLTKNFYLAYSSSACTSLKRIFNLSPNPASSFINIERTNSDFNFAKAKIQIVDMFGNVRLSSIWDGETKRISTTALKNGQYFIKVYVDQKLYSDVFLIQH